MPPILLGDTESPLAKDLPSGQTSYPNSNLILPILRYPCRLGNGKGQRRRQLLEIRLALDRLKELCVSGGTVSQSVERDFVTYPGFGRRKTEVVLRPLLDVLAWGTEWPQDTRRPNT